jgi:hypothetical protein
MSAPISLEDVGAIGLHHVTGIPPATSLVKEIKHHGTRHR